MTLQLCSSFFSHCQRILIKKAKWNFQPIQGMKWKLYHLYHFFLYIFLSGFYFVISFSESNHRVHLYLFVKHRGNSSLKVQNINLSKLLTSTIWWQMISSWHEPLFQNNLIIPKIIRGSALLEISDKLNFVGRLRSTDLGSLIGNTRCGNCRIFLTHRFYVKSILVILRHQKLPFWKGQLWILKFGNFWHF